MNTSAVSDELNAKIIGNRVDGYRVLLCDGKGLVYPEQDYVIGKPRTAWYLWRAKRIGKQMVRAERRRRATDTEVRVS